MDDDNIQGFPIEPGLVIIGGIVFVTFCNAFIKEFGAETGKKTAQKLSSWLETILSKKPAPSFSNSISKNDQELVISTLYNITKEIRLETYLNLRDRILEAVNSSLIEQGLPRRRSIQVAKDVIQLIELEIGIKTQMDDMT